MNGLRLQVPLLLLRFTALPLLRAPGADVAPAFGGLLILGYSVYVVYIVAMAFLSAWRRNAVRNKRGLKPAETVWGPLTAFDIVFAAVLIAIVPLFRWFVHIQTNVLQIGGGPYALYATGVCAVAPFIILFLYKRRRRKDEAASDTLTPTDNLCPCCRRINPPEAVTCENCGFGLDPPEPQPETVSDDKPGRSYTLLEIILTVLVVIATLIGVYLLRKA